MKVLLLDDKLNRKQNALIKYGILDSLADFQRSGMLIELSSIPEDWQTEFLQYDCIILHRSANNAHSFINAIWEWQKKTGKSVVLFSGDNRPPEFRGENALSNLDAERMYRNLNPFLKYLDNGGEIQPKRLVFGEHFRLEEALLIQRKLIGQFRTGNASAQTLEPYFNELDELASQAGHTESFFDQFTSMDFTESTVRNAAIQVINQLRRG